MARTKEVLAKLTPPHLPVILNRSRLFRYLDQATKTPVTWLAAPPGAGKTTLLASYLQKRARTVIWYRLDAGDADPSTLFHYLGVAVQSASPRFRRRLPHLTPEYMAGLATFTQRFFEQLGNRFHHPTVIVFDNYHEVQPDSIVHQLLPVAVERLPNHVRAVVLSREKPPASYARLRAEQRLETIQAAELELTREEARRLSRLRHTAIGRIDSHHSVDHVWELTKGWLAGFILMLQQREREPAITDVATQQSSQAVFDYLAGEVFARLPQDSQTVLLTVSILSDFTIQMAQVLSSVVNAADILEQLHQSHYFVERREDRIGWYRLHPLFQEFLLRRATQTWTREVLGELRRKAAALLMEAHQEEQAITLLQQAQAWDDYRAVVRALATRFAQQGRTQTLDKWIQQLPEAQREADPWMDFWVANGRLLLAPQEAARLYESAMMRFQEQSERAGMLLAWSGAVQSTLVAWSGMKRIHDLVRLFDEFHPQGTGYPSPEVEAVVAQAMAGAYMQMYPNRAKAREWLDRSVELAHTLPPSLRGSEIVMTTIYYIWLGDREKAQTVFAHQQRTCANETSVSMRLMIATTEATLSWYSGDAERCRNAVRKGLDLAEREGLLTWNGLLHAQAVYTELMFGNIRVARSYLERMQPFSRSGGNLFVFLLLEGWADLIEGDIDLAWHKCQQARAILETEGFILWHTGTHHLFEAQVLAARGQRAEAQQRLKEVEVIGQVLPGFFSFGVCFLRAQWAFQDGDEVNGTIWLRRLLEEGKKNSQIAYVGWISWEASRLFAKALELDLERTYACEVIRKWRLKPPADGRALRHWPWWVKIWTFRKLAVEVDGKPMEKHRKAPHRLLELLTAIIVFGGKDISISRLIDALWPEVEGDTARENFKKSLARLRKLLRVEDVILWQDGKIALNPDLCWVDVLAFEQQAKQEDIRAVGMYKGPLLGLEEIPFWAQSQREQVRTTFVRLVTRHCDQVQAGDRVDEAIRSLERAIAVDPLAEPLYHRLIPLLLAQGRRADAQRYYQAYMKACRQWKDGGPSEQILRLGQSLTH